MRDDQSGYTHISERLGIRSLTREVILEANKRVIADSLEALERWESIKVRWQVLEAKAEKLQRKINEFHR